MTSKPSKPQATKTHEPTVDRDKDTGRFTPPPRRVPLGFTPGQTVRPIEIAR